MLLDDLTEEKYRELRKVHSNDEKVAKALFVSTSTLNKKKVELGINGVIISEIKEKRRKEMEKKVNTVKELSAKGYTSKQIANELGIDSLSAYNNFKLTARRRGFSFEG